jgi:probable F420-dependent oxidoreductase
VRFSLTLPTDRVDQPEQFLTAAAVMEMASALETIGADACHVTDHPFPPQAFVDGGGHHALDPMVALSFAAAATARLELHTNVFIPTYRNPFVAAKAVATLDVLSGGRVILGVAAGYLEEEFAACGAQFEQRGVTLDSHIAAMRMAWSGAPVIAEGSGWRSSGNVMLPTPLRPIPIWIGGNSASAMRRAVRLGDGWSPFPASSRTAGVLRTVPLASLEDLRKALDGMDQEVERIGRRSAPEVCLTPFSHPHHRPTLDPARLVDEALELEALGVRWLAVRLPGDDRRSFLSSIERFGESVIRRLNP